MTPASTRFRPDFLISLSMSISIKPQLLECNLLMGTAARLGGRNCNVAAVEDRGGTRSGNHQAIAVTKNRERAGNGVSLPGHRLSCHRISSFDNRRGINSFHRLAELSDSQPSIS